MDKLIRVLNKLYITWIWTILLVGAIGTTYCTVVTFHDSFVVMKALYKVKIKYPQLGINEYGDTREELDKLQNMPFEYFEGIIKFYALGEAYNGNKYVSKYTQDLEEAGFDVSINANSRYVSIYVGTHSLTWGDTDFSNFWTGMGFCLYWIFGTVFMIALSAGIRRWLIWISK